MALRGGIEQSRLGKKIGRRGFILVIAGLAWTGSGIDLLNTNINRFSRPGPTGNDYLQLMDGSWVGWLWIVCGLFAFLVGAFRHRPWIANREVLGFNAILTPPFLWFLTYIWSLIAFIVSGGEQGRAASAVALFVWGLVCLFIMTIAGWPEVSKSSEVRMVIPPERDKEQ